MTDFNGYTEAAQIDAALCKVYKETKPLSLTPDHEPGVNLERRQARNRSHERDIQMWQREMLKYLRTIETTCALLQDEIQQDLIRRRE